MSPPKPIAELPITGYLDRFSHRPGETFQAHVSVRDGGQARARLVRVISGDPNPAGPGLRFEDLSHRLDLTFAGRRQPIHLGSCAIVPRAPRRDAGPCTWTALVWLGAAPEGEATVICEADGGTVARLAIGRDGVTGIVTGAQGAVVVATGKAPALRRWHRLWLSAGTTYAFNKDASVDVGVSYMHGQHVEFTEGPYTFKSEGKAWLYGANFNYRF